MIRAEPDDFVRPPANVVAQLVLQCTRDDPTAIKRSRGHAHDSDPRQAVTGDAARAGVAPHSAVQFAEGHEDAAATQPTAGVRRHRGGDTAGNHRSAKPTNCCDASDAGATRNLFVAMDDVSAAGTTDLVHSAEAGDGTALPDRVSSEPSRAVSMTRTNSLHRIRAAVIWAETESCYRTISLMLRRQGGGSGAAHFGQRSDGGQQDMSAHRQAFGRVA
jgi:hypothetical protein